MTKTPARKRTPPPVETEQKQAPTKADLAEGLAAVARRDKRRPAVPAVLIQKPGGEADITIESATTEHGLCYERLRDVTGTRSEDWMNGVIRDLINSAGGKSDPASHRTGGEGLAFLNGLQPGNEIEAALGAQMFAVHRATMKAAQRLGAADDLTRLQVHANVMTKAARTFTSQVEALAKLRSGGKQQVEVRYIYVDARGGQNVIGSSIGGGGGAECAGQPRVPGVAPPHGLPMWSEDPPGDLLPATSDEGPQALQEAWREESGRAER